MEALRKELYLAHHGIKGQKWGKRNGPPYPLGASDHSASEKKAGWRKSLGNGSENTGNARKKKPTSPSVETAKQKATSLDNFDKDKALRIARNVAIGAVAAGVILNVSSQIDYGEYKQIPANIKQAAYDTVSSFKGIRSYDLPSKPVSELYDDPIVEEGKRYTRKLFAPNSIYNKKHFDEVLKPGTVLSTLSYDPHRTEGADMFYATHKVLDKHQYNALFNNPIQKALYDENGNSMGTGSFLKYRINNTITSAVKVASEDSGARVFRNLYESDSDFRDFVRDSSRMKSHFVEDKYKFRGYREARKALENLENGKSATYDDLHTIYRMFNYVIPSDGGGDALRAEDVARQRAKFFSALQKAGYGAVLDTNDAIYGGFKATSPVIVFDQSKVVLSGVEQTKMTEKRISELATIGRKFLGV